MRVNKPNPSQNTTTHSEFSLLTGFLLCLLIMAMCDLQSLKKSSGKPQKNKKIQQGKKALLLKIRKHEKAGIRDSAAPPGIGNGLVSIFSAQFAGMQKCVKLNCNYNGIAATRKTKIIITYYATKNVICLPHYFFFFLV